MVSKAVKRLLARDGPAKGHQIGPDAGAYLDFFANSWPTTRDTIAPETFTLQPAFTGQLQSAITSGKKGKAPGPDHKTCLEMLKLDCALFAQATSALWAAAGRTHFVPSLLRSGTLIPVPKRKSSGDPKNYSLIVLLSVFRRVISAALNRAFSAGYTVHPNQFGFTQGSRTEINITKLDNFLHRAQQGPSAVLDLRQAYGPVNRQKILELLRNRLSGTLSRHIAYFLVPFLLRCRKHGRSYTATSGVLQGDPLSTLLFDIFMDFFLETMNITGGEEAICFAEKVIVLSETSATFQEILLRASEWSQSAGMEWNTWKFAVLTIDSNKYKIDGQPLS